MKKILTFIGLIIFQFSFTQEIIPNLDRSIIQIGESIKYQSKIDYKEGDKIIFPSISDSLDSHIFVLDSRLDTVNKNGKLEIIQNLQLTSYDTGKFLIPSLTIKKNGVDFNTKSLEIDVKDVKIDTTKNAIFPIKNVMEERLSFKDYWNIYWLYGMIVIVLFIIASILIVLYIRSKSKLTKRVYYKDPYDEFKNNLKSLDSEKYLKKGEQKEYYTKLSYILRRYLGRVYQFSALEILSDDLLNFISQKEDILPQDIAEFKKFLFDSDLVKFAKMKIDDSISEKYRIWIEEFVDRIKPIEIPQNNELKEDRVTGDKYKKFNNN